MSLVFSPLFLLLMAGLLLALGQRRRALRWMGLACLLAGWLGCTPLVANLLVGAIESRAVARAGDCDGVQGIVLLGGGLQREPSGPRDVQSLSTDSQQRVMTFLERDRPEWPLMIAGGGRHEISEADLMRDLLQRIAPSRRVEATETASRTTMENALNVAKAWPPPRRIALATSALHLPRARRAFEAAGFDVCPWPLQRAHIDAGGLRALLPRGSAALKTEAALHELGGSVVYAFSASGR